MTMAERLVRAWFLMRTIDNLYGQAQSVDDAPQDGYSLLLDLEAELEEQLDVLERDLDPREVEIAFLAVCWNLGRPLDVPGAVALRATDPGPPLSATE